MCDLARRQFCDLLTPGRTWSWSSLEKTAAEVKHPNFKGDSKLGVKCSPLWKFIPLKNFLPPLLHILIGIWNDIWDKFWEIVSECIEYIPRDEADLRCRKESLIEKLLTYAREETTGRRPSRARSWSESKGGGQGYARH